MTYVAARSSESGPGTSSFGSHPSSAHTAMSPQIRHNDNRLVMPSATCDVTRVAEPQQWMILVIWCASHATMRRFAAMTQYSFHVAISPVSHLRTFFLFTDGSFRSARHFSSALAGVIPGLSHEGWRSSDTNDMYSELRLCSSCSWEPWMCNNPHTPHRP